MVHVWTGTVAVVVVAVVHCFWCGDGQASGLSPGAWRGDGWLSVACCGSWLLLLPLYQHTPATIVTLVLMVGAS